MGETFCENEHKDDSWRREGSNDCTVMAKAREKDAQDVPAGGASNPIRNPAQPEESAQNTAHSWTGGDYRGGPRDLGSNTP